MLAIRFAPGDGARSYSAQPLWHEAIGRIGRKNLLLSSNWFVPGGSTLLSMERDIGSIHEALAKQRGVTEIDVKLDGSCMNSSQHQGNR
jgi:hypothetical protein